MKLPYIPALDGVRALAIILVILFHWPFDFLTLQFGWIGVNIFFVLSGFLITRILVKAKPNPLKKYLIKFYKNRVLRIFPLYFGFTLLLLFILYLLATFFSQQISGNFLIKNFAEIKIEIFSLFGFFYNFSDLFQIVNEQNNNQLHPFFGHYWSLSAEEQFYLVFPVTVYFLKPRPLKALFLTLIILSPFIRLVTGEILRNSHDANVIGSLLTKLTIFHLDAFAIGGMVSLFPVHQISKPVKYLFLYCSGCFGLGCYTVFILNQHHIFIGWDSLGFDHPFFQYGQQTALLWTNIRYAFTFSIVNLGAGLLLVASLQQNWLSAFLHRPLFKFIGQISFGLYVFHLPINAVLNYYFKRADFLGNRLSELILFGAYLSLLSLLAWLSFKYYETYFLRLKNKNFER